LVDLVDLVDLIDLNDLIDLIDLIDLNDLVDLVGLVDLVFFVCLVRLPFIRSGVLSCLLVRNCRPVGHRTLAVYFVLRFMYPVQVIKYII
jgi:hypothetical protein